MDDQPLRRRTVLVLGGRESGAEALTGALRTLGMRVPGPADGEVPRWVSDLHDELLQRCNVDADDARPSAWFDAGRLAHLEPLRHRVHTWLEERFVADGPELVVGDHRLAWFVGLWRSAALRCDAAPSYVTVLRHPAASTGPGTGNGTGAGDDVAAVAGWLNVQLHTERATRASTRAFVLHDDLVADWTVPVSAVGAAFDLHAVAEARANDIRAVHTYLAEPASSASPSSPAPGRSWDDLDLPDPLRALAEQTWTALSGLAPDGAAEDPATLARLDALRADYTATYDAAAALTRSSTRAAHRAGLVTLPEPERAVVRRGADRVPHSVRAALPSGLRRTLRRSLGRGRG